jgi:cytochrome c2
MTLGLSVLVFALVGCTGGGGGGTSSSGGSGDANKGKTLFTSKQCITCHTLASIPGAVGTIGPNMNGIGTRAGERKPGMAAADYLRESLKTPDAYTVEGYAKGLMVLPVPVTDAEINDLVAFLLAQK